jgi:hypothetical protein
MLGASVGSAELEALDAILMTANLQLIATQASSQKSLLDSVTTGFRDVQKQSVTTLQTQLHETPPQIDYYKKDTSVDWWPE